jgi:hypothetical protein
MRLIIMRTTKYVPTPAEIRRACAEIRSQWTNNEQAKRAIGARAVRETVNYWVAPEYSMRELASIHRGFEAN